MEFTVEFYTSASGHSPVREFLLELKASDLDTAREGMHDWKDRNDL